MLIERGLMFNFELYLADNVINLSGLFGYQLCFFEHSRCQIVNQLNLKLLLLQFCLMFLIKLLVYCHLFLRCYFRLMQNIIGNINLRWTDSGGTRTILWLWRWYHLPTWFCGYIGANLNVAQVSCLILV